MQQAETKKLSEKIFFAYGFQEFALGFLTTMGVQYMTYFLTDVALIPAATVATIMLIGRIVDTCDIPIISMIVERSNLPWGKYRSWLFIAAPLVMVFNFLMFSNFDVSLGVKVVYLSLSYILAYIFVNFCSSARMALLPVFTNDPGERAKLSVRRGQGSALSNAIRGAITVPLVTFLGGGNAEKGYAYTVVLYGIIVIIGLYWIAILAKDYDKPRAAGGPATKQATIKDMLVQLAINKPLLIIVLSNTLMLTATNILTGFNMYYFRYVVGNLNLFSLYMPITFGGMFLGNSAASILLKKFRSKKKVYVIGMSIYAAGIGLVYLFAGNSAVMFITFIAIAQFGAGISNGLVPAFFSDTADYGEWKTGKSVRAVNMGLVIFPIKLGVLIGGSIASYGLAYIGFVAGTTDPAVINGIRFMATIPNIIAAVLAALVILLWPLTESNLAEIQQTLKDRAKAQAQA